MGLGRWFTKNWANTIDPTHPDLTPVRLPIPFPDAYQRVLQAIQTLPPRWAVVDRVPNAIHLTRRTRVFGFIDDIVIGFAQEGVGVTLVHAESRSRIGKGDLGQNRRNILELFAAVRKYS
jgi:uncharacterized protein (DUF1499 family)